MKMEMYVAPELEVLEVMVEKGFAASGGDFGGDPITPPVGGSDDF